MIKNINEYIQRILTIGRGLETVHVFRGHSDASYKLIPSIFRKGEYIENEHKMLRELIVAHPEEFKSDSTTLECLARMQHFSLPTRLLDATHNPLAALYFACQSDKKRVVVSGKRKVVEPPGQVLMLSLDISKVRYYDSDQVSCMANLAGLSWDLKEQIDTSLPKDKFNESLPIRRLLHLIRQEKIGFEPDIISEQLKDIVLVKSKQNNKRIVAQSGCFFVFGLDRELSDTNKCGIKITTIDIDPDEKSNIMQQLDKLSINGRYMFPDIEHTAGYIRDNSKNTIDYILSSVI